MAFSLRHSRYPAVFFGLIVLGVFFTFGLLFWGSKQSFSSLPGGTSHIASGEEDSFRILDQATGTILTVPDREFLTGGLICEMSLSCEEEALKAQVVACYTYYGRLREQRRISGGEEADFSCNTEEFLTYTTQAQRRARWGDSFDTYEEKASAIVDAVYGQELVTPSGEKVCACFFAISSGQTDNAADIWGGEEACLQAVASPGDAYAPGYMTTVTYSASELYKALHQAFPKADLSASSPLSDVTITSRSAAGTILQADVGSVSCTGSELRMALSLRSAHFTWTLSEDGGATFTVRGWGHNVGMSQEGACALARCGLSYREILAWYYPGSRLVEKSSAS